MPKLSLLEQQWYYLTQSWADKKVYTFPKSLKFEFTTLLHIKLYATRTLPYKFYYT